MVPLLGLIVGLIIGIFIPYHIPVNIPIMQQFYFKVALDSVLGRVIGLS